MLGCGEVEDVQPLFFFERKNFTLALATSLAHAHRNIYIYSLHSYHPKEMGIRTPVTSGTVPDVTMAQGAERAMSSARRARAPGISTASAPWDLGRRLSICWTSVNIFSMSVTRKSHSPGKSHHMSHN